jgi:hypothetical protein
MRSKYHASIVRLDQSTHRRVEELAAADNRTVGGLLRKIIVEYFKHHADKASSDRAAA